MNSEHRISSTDFGAQNQCDALHRLQTFYNPLLTNSASFVNQKYSQARQTFAVSANDSPVVEVTGTKQRNYSRNFLNSDITNKYVKLFNCTDVGRLVCQHKKYRIEETL